MTISDEEPEHPANPATNITPSNILSRAVRSSRRSDEEELGGEEEPTASLTP
jgi:hypothetical protein